MSFFNGQFVKSSQKKNKEKWRRYKYCHLDGSEKHYETLDDATNEEIELDNTFNGKPACRGRHSKSRTSTPESIHYVEHSIEEGDTLQKLSLLYGCSVAELKKANRLLSNQEFYGLKTIRIPVKQFSVLTEIIPASGCSKDVSKSDEQVRTFHIGISQVLNGEKKSEAAAFLERMDKDLTRIRESTKNYKDSLEEVTETLTSPQFKPVIEECKFNGADYVLHWKSLLCIVIIFILAIAGIVYLCFTSPALVAGNYSKPQTI